MKMKRPFLWLATVLAIAVHIPLVGCNPASNNISETQEAESESTLTVTDALGREVKVPQPVERVVASGSGALRYLTYLQVQDRVVGVDDNEMEGRSKKRPRPYRLANPQFGELPLIGEFRGKDNPEQLLAIGPQVIFKVGVGSEAEVEQLEQQTGIPVIAINYGDLATDRALMYETFDLMGEVMGVSDRAEALQDYIESILADVEQRTANIPEDEKPTVYVGGVAKTGPQNFQSTEPAYAPFRFLNTPSVAAELGTDYASVDKEKIIEWDPEIILVDAAAFFTSPSAFDELRTDPSYQQLTAVEQGQVYGVWPYNLYNANLENILINTYGIGQILYPEQFEDIDLPNKADEILSFFVDEPLYDTLVELYQVDYSQVEL